MTTERDDQPVRELSMVSTKTHTRLLAQILHGLEAGSVWIALTKSARDLLARM